MLRLRKASCPALSRRPAAERLAPERETEYNEENTEQGGSHMDGQIKGAGLEITVREMGAELQSLRCGGREWMWSGDKAVWGRRAPACFPWCGRLKDGYFEQDGRRYENGPHGFAREYEHTMIERDEKRLVFRLDWSEETLARYPWKFRFETVYEAEGRTLRSTYRVTNLDERTMPFQAGFHYAFALPLTEGLDTGGHELRFEGPEEPEEVLTPEGFVTGTRPRFTGQDRVALDDRLFEQDSICLKGLRTRWIELGTKEPGPALRLGMEGFPYVLLWSKPGPMRFVCIEPWHGLPDAAGGDHDLFHRPAVRLLEPGETFSCTQTVTVMP